MRTLAKIAATLGVVGAIAGGSAAPAAAWYGYHHHYYNYYGGGWGTWNGCTPRWTIQAAFVSRIIMVCGTGTDTATGTGTVNLEVASN